YQGAGSRRGEGSDRSIWLGRFWRLARRYSRRRAESTRGRAQEGRQRKDRRINLETRPCAARPMYQLARVKYFSRGRLCLKRTDKAANVYSRSFWLREDAPRGSFWHERRTMKQRRRDRRLWNRLG